MEGSSFSNEFPDFITENMLDINQPAHVRSEKGMATYVYTEIIKQLEEAENEIAAWFGDILQEPVSPDLVNSLRDGTILCQVAQLLYPSYPLEEWIPFPQSYQDYSINLNVFAYHCAGIGIHQELILSEQQFNDNDLAKLITCLLEYKEQYYRLLQEQESLESTSIPPSTVIQSDLQENPVMESPDVVNKPLLSESSDNSKQSTCCACCGCTFM